jgi:flagellin
MALVVNTNIASLTAQNYLSESRREMELAMERLSSGKRINSASDDAAGLAISTRMDAQIRGMSKAVQNANDGISLTQTAQGAQKEITEMLQRMRELAVQASNSSNNTSDRAALDAEVQQLSAEIDQIAEDTMFNQQVLLDGKFNGSIQTGAFLGQETNFSIASMQTADLGLASTSNSGVDLQTYITGRVGLSPSHGAIEAGDIVINGQHMAAIAAADDIKDVVDNINTNIENVTASAFNEVVMYNAGTGEADANDIMISVQNVGSTSATTEVQFQAYMIDEDSESLEDLAQLINLKTEGKVTASVNTDGKLVLTNDTGAAIQVKDLTTGARATGLSDGANVDESQAAASDAFTPQTSSSTDDARTFYGFLKLETTDEKVTIQKGLGQASGLIGTQTQLDILGMNQVNVNDDSDTTYSVTGDALTAPTTAWEVGDVKINGVDVYNTNIATDTFIGKLNTINSVTDVTGVRASAEFEYFIDATTFSGFSGVVTLTDDDGSTTANVTLSTASVAANVTALNTGLDSVGGNLTAEAIGNQIRIFSDSDTDQTALTFTFNAAASANTTVAAAFTGLSGNTSAQQVNAAIQLESTGSSAIQIDAGEDITDGTLGFQEANVGVADFDSNGTGVSAGSTVSSLDITTVASAQNAITSIDAALLQVSDSAAALGAIESRLGHVIANLSETIVNTEASKSRIMDADFAVESAKLAKQQILQQAASAMLAQANAAPQSVLSLLGG